MNLFTITEHIIDAAVKVHRELGPGLFERVYETVLAHELTKRGLRIHRQAPINLIYEGEQLALPTNEWAWC